MNEDQLAEEIAWGTINAMHWVASPELLFALKAYIIELEGERIKASALALESS